MVLDIIKKEIDNYNNKLDALRSDTAIVIFGEAECCSFEEKVLIGLTCYNRERSAIRFNSIKKDYLGYHRKFFIDNKEFKRDSIIASFTADVISRKNIKELKNIYFFNLHGRFPSTIYPVSKVESLDGFKHSFFKIISRGNEF